MPMDQFAIEQIAGDLLPEATPRQRLATAFNRQTLTNTEGGADQEEFRNAALFDRTETIGTIWARAPPSRALVAMTTNTTRFLRAITTASSLFSTMRTRRTTICRLLARLAGNTKEEKAGNRGGAEGDRRGEIAQAKTKHGDAFETWQTRPVGGDLAQANCPPSTIWTEMELTSDVEGVGFEVEESGSRSGERRQPRTG